MRNNLTLKITIKRSIVVFLVTSILFTIIPIINKSSNSNVNVNAWGNARITNVDSYVNLRERPSMASRSICLVELYSGVDAIEVVVHDSDDNSGCNRWCRIRVPYNGGVVEGFVPTKYVHRLPNPNTVCDPAFEEHIAGFPDSYKPFLRELHIEHPSWSFSVSPAGSWGRALSLETRRGASLIENTVRDDWKASSEIIEAPNWVNASEGIVAYYMDPRNMLDETSIFQFINLRNTSNLDIAEGNIESMLAGTFMGGASCSSDEGSYLFSHVFKCASNESGVNPLFLATKVIQEVGRNGGTATNGEYNGCYNFYNIGAYASKESPVKNGLNFAREGYSDQALNDKFLLPWVNQARSIIGGAKWIAEKYINAGQDTMYYMRFNVSDVAEAKGAFCSHQYMTAIRSTLIEAVRMSNIYSSAGLYENSLNFQIPVFDDMPSSPADIPGYRTRVDYSEVVKNMYRGFFEREPSDLDVTNWNNYINDNSVVDFIAVIINSQEFTNRNLSNSEYIEILYNVLLGRGVDAVGYEHYNGMMNEYYSKMAIFAAIVNSTEARENLARSVFDGEYYTNSDPVDSQRNYVEFLKTQYKNILCRDPDYNGIIAWAHAMAIDGVSGHEVTGAFVNSPEFNGSSCSNEEFLSRLYKCCLGRDIDGVGLNEWLELLELHYTREYIVANIVNSAEAANIYSSYGVSGRAFVPTHRINFIPDNDKISEFVENLYNQAFQRKSDSEGHDNWVSQLINGSNGRDVVCGFVFSDEAKGITVSNDEYIKMLYHTFLNREPDEGGFNYWMSRLNSGEDREDVLDGFAGSSEFIKICLRIGVRPYAGFDG